MVLLFHRYLVLLLSSSFYPISLSLSSSAYLIPVYFRGLLYFPCWIFCFLHILLVNGSAALYCPASLLKDTSTDGIFFAFDQRSESSTVSHVSIPPQRGLIPLSLSLFLVSPAPNLHPVFGLACLQSRLFPTSGAENSVRQFARTPTRREITRHSAVGTFEIASIDRL